MSPAGLLWQLRGSMRRCGWSGAAALVGAVLIGLFCFFLLRPQSQALTDTREEVLRLRAVKNGTVAATSAVTPAEDLAAFYQFFPARERLPDYLERIYRAADQQGVQLERGDYQQAAEKDLKLLRHEIALPVKGSYLQIRRFVAQVQNDVPPLALDGIVFSRQRINDPQIDAQIRFVLYLRAGP